MPAVTRSQTKNNASSTEVKPPCVSTNPKLRLKLKVKNNVREMSFPELYRFKQLGYKYEETCHELNSELKNIRVILVRYHGMGYCQVLCHNKNIKNDHCYHLLLMGGSNGLDCHVNHLALLKLDESNNSKDYLTLNRAYKYAKMTSEECSSPFY